MTTNHIIELMNQTPFQPLEIRLTDGTSIIVEDPFDISAARNSAVCYIYEGTSRFRTIAVRNITEVITNRPVNS